MPGIALAVNNLGYCCLTREVNRVPRCFLRVRYKGRSICGQFSFQKRDLLLFFGIFKNFIFLNRLIFIGYSSGTILEK